MSVKESTSVIASPNQYPPVGEPPDGNLAFSPVSLTAEQKAKLHSELDLVESNAKVLSEMLSELTPGKEEPEDLQLLQDLYATCRAMQERVVELVGRITDDLLTADLLRINDDLNNTFVRYERHISKNKAKSNALGGIAPRNKKTVVPEVPRLPEIPKKEEEAPLIDLGEESANEQLAALSVGKKADDADFDTFAQSRTSTDEKSSDGPESLPVQNERPSDFDEMEEWLQENQGKNKSQNGTMEESLSSSEFDKFLAERASAADALPSLSSSGANIPTISAATGSSSRSRTLTKNDQNEKQLFSL